MLPYDDEDRSLTPGALETKYAEAKAHPYYKVSDWAIETGHNLSYWDWVASKIAGDVTANPDPEEQEPMDNRGYTPVPDMETLVRLMKNWHENRIARLEQMLEIPEGSQASLNDGELIVLEGHTLEAFKIGLTTALSEFENFPIVISSTADDSIESSENPDDQDTEGSGL